MAPARGATGARRITGTAARIGVAAVLAAAAGGCGGAAPPAHGPEGAAAAGRRNCLEPAGHPMPGSAFVVALTDPVDPARAPVPSNPSEAVVFRLLYETLTRVDCTGAVSPALATDWHASPDGLVWTFRLRRDVRLARADRDDALLLDAALVRESWRDSRRRLLDAGRTSWPWERVLLRDVRAAGPDRLEVETRTPEPDLPALLSRPEFAVAVRAPDAAPGDWPRGTRGVVTDADPAAAARDLVWWPESKDAGATVARITFRVRPGADARDLADADLLFVRDRAALAYFESREDRAPAGSLRSASLLLLTRDPWIAEAVTADARLDLAARATAALAEAASGSGEETVLRSADDASAGSPSSPLRYVFDAGDAAAGDVARRLAATCPRGPAVAEGLPAGAFAAALRRGDGNAFVARIAAAPSRGLEPVQLAGIAPWIARGSAVPLLDPYVVPVARTGLTGIAAGRDGVPRLENAGWIRGRQP